MLDDRDSGWDKIKKQNDKGPKKVEDLRRDLEKKHREEEKAREAEMNDLYS